eukprot:476353-Pyramimonas_sp.AAC.1
MGRVDVRATRRAGAGRAPAVVCVKRPEEGLASTSLTAVRATLKSSRAFRALLSNRRLNGDAADMHV